MIVLEMIGKVAIQVKILLVLPDKIFKRIRIVLLMYPMPIKLLLHSKFNLPAFVVRARSFRGFLKTVWIHGDKKVDTRVI